MAVGHIMGRFLKKKNKSKGRPYKRQQRVRHHGGPTGGLTTHVKCDTGKMQQVAKGITVPKATYC